MLTKSVSETMSEALEIAATTKCSVGFCRLASLSETLRTNFNKAALLNGTKVTEVASVQKNFLEDLTEEEFKNWITVNS